LSVSEKVQALYKEYPYPSREPCEALDPYVDYVRSLASVSGGKSPSFLDAGCGTGAMLLGAALFNRDWDIYGCDFNVESLRMLQQDLDEMSLTNVTTRQVDLLDFPDDFGPEGGFDVIFCTGVIHHTAEPVKILKSLAGRLAPQGVLRLMVYADRGRSDLYRFANAIQELEEWRGLGLKPRLAAARNLMAELHRREELDGFPPPCLRGPFEGSHEIHPVEFADRYLHPHDSPYTLQLLRKHIAESGLHFYRWFEARNWDLSELLPVTQARGDFPHDPWEQFAIVEDLFDRDQYDCYLVGPAFKPNDEEFSYDQPLRINPQVHLTETTFRGFPKSHRAKLLFYPEEELSYPQARILKAVSRRTATLGELLEEWGKKRSDDWLRAGISLLDRDLIYRPMPRSQSVLPRSPKDK
jgi:SAM-dependent methyltransferase